MVALTIPYFTMPRAQAVIEEMVGIKGQVTLQTAVGERGRGFSASAAPPRLTLPLDWLGLALSNWRQSL
jgi:hypothetical protein